LLDDVIDSSDAGLFILDSDFKVVWVNQALERYFGLKRAEVVGKNKRQLIQEQIKYNFEDPEGFAERVLATYDNNTYVENFECHMLSGNKREDRWLEHWSRPIRSGLYSGGRIELYYNITDQRHAEEALQKAHDELERRVEERTEELNIKTKSLEEINTAMKVLLKKREEDKIELQDNILSNVKTLIEPYVGKLKRSSLPQGQKTLISILESNLNEIVSPFTRKLSSKYLNLSPSEIQVANLVKYGKTNKEISEMLNVTQRTIAFHRENIRKKLDLTNQKTNLKTYLMSLD
jgi:PAS domain S-box-containing protein